MAYLGIKNLGEFKTEFENSLGCWGLGIID
jgi:hypothetical protein